jgi:hypothetical protein
VLDADSFLMKGETLDAYSGWRGNPAKMVRGSVAEPETAVADDAGTAWQEPAVQRLAAE